ncbi:maleylpyruvate isomerase family mycothiol-dependent enzyme [Streptomyces sp. NBC_01571]|uniref:maleylpyruvate isomerase family mycothiol-dependent enzyme n=1 Tax=Streptomyces sp. NBC_01571 TaxID=2975883 RepID=UPI00225279D7|nr:maleylpyruvate isomerase family mycothiol-dependent enzyme [Streptomyces sp. NBC_01571]MCX4572653.1 maleylpyruvate isomerase family mycothiol-dependent enzyme [Streptomyces sp. NBC_01571]
MPNPSWLGKPIDARPLFGPEPASLLDLLRGLRRNEWSRAAVPGWTVRDLAAHILGDYHGRLGWSTESHQRAKAVGETMEAFIRRVNQEWVDLHADHRPAELIEALELAGTEVARQFEGDDLDARGLGVSWAGADPAPKWLDIAREFTEYWTHRQQIRHATGRDTDPETDVLSTVLDTFMRALPHTLRHTPAPAGTQLQMVIVEPAVGTWTVTATADRRSLAEAPRGRPAASVRLDAETAWRLCTRGIDPGTALARARISGERQIAEAACQIVSIVR